MATKSKRGNTVYNCFGRSDTTLWHDQIRAHTKTEAKQKFKKRHPKAFHVQAYADWEA